MAVVIENSHSVTGTSLCGVSSGAARGHLWNTEKRFLDLLGEEACIVNLKVIRATNVAGLLESPGLVSLRGQILLKVPYQPL